MFAPVGYTPLSMLWDQFIDKRIDAIYLSAANYYSDKEFDCAKVRGSPLDIAEHLFLELMWKCWVHAATPDGQLTRLHSRFDDHTTGLFTKQAPYTSVWGAAMTEVEMGNRDAIEKVAGPYFEEWTYEPEEAGEWANTYPELKDNNATIPEDICATLRFHTLPICFERETFCVVETLPIWARLQNNKREALFLVHNFHARTLCVPDSALEGWDKVLSGETPILQEDLLQAQGENKPDRKSVV